MNPTVHENLVPDVSLGTHFLNELVEMNMLYLALFPEKGSNYLSKEYFEKSSSRLLDLVPAAVKWQDAVRVIDARQDTDTRRIKLSANAVEQKVICYFE